MLVLGACGGNKEEKAPETIVDTTTVAAVDTTPKAPEFKPFDMVEITHKVKDYDKWRPLFNSDSTARKASGLDFIVIGRKMENPNDLMVVLQASDVQKAKAFSEDPRLKEVMKTGGVISKPDVAFFHVLRFNSESKEKQWVVITHKVKDYDAWLKVFDEEGTATRASFGLIDVVLARGVDDPNTVQIVFDITDMEKAKARMNSPELKKIMTDAGVDGKPNIGFYTSAD